MKKAVSGIMLTLLFAATFFMVQEVSAGGVVRFRGPVVLPESQKDFVCYGSYFCRVYAEEVLYDPNNTLYGYYLNVEICYDTQLSLEVDEIVECYGYYYVSGACPMQYCGRCVCEGGYFYIRRFFPDPVPAVGGTYIPTDKPELLAPYVGLTILLAVAIATVVYANKRKLRGMR